MSLVLLPLLITICRGHHDELSAADLFIFSYVSSETSAAAVKNKLVFYSDLSKVAKTGSMFVFLDVRLHAQPAFDAIALAMGDKLKRLDVSIELPCDTMVLVK